MEAVLPTEWPLSLLSAEKERTARMQTEKPPKPKSCARKRVLLANYLRLATETEKAAYDYREVITVGLDGHVRQAARNRIETAKAESEKAQAEYVDHCRAHSC